VLSRSENDLDGLMSVHQTARVVPFCGADLGSCFKTCWKMPKFLAPEEMLDNSVLTAA
jgi:hypothetical protein